MTESQQPHLPYQSRAGPRGPRCPWMLLPAPGCSPLCEHNGLHLSTNQIDKTQCLSEAWGHLWGRAVQWSSLWKSAKC